MAEMYFMVTKEHTVLLKPPTSWIAQPEVWFTQAKAQLNLCRITADDTNYYVVAALEQDTATRVLDFISQPPDDNKYQALKPIW